MDLSQHQNLMTIFWQVLVFSRLCLPYPTLHSLKVCLCEVIFCCITDNNVIVKFTNPCHLFLKRWWPLILQLSGLFAGLLKKLLWNSKSTRISFKGHMLFTQNTAWQVLSESQLASSSVHWDWHLMSGERKSAKEDGMHSVNYCAINIFKAAKYSWKV